MKPSYPEPSEWVRPLAADAWDGLPLPSVWEWFESHEAYESFLESAGLPHSGAESLLVTREHSDFGYSGGIGTYAAELCRLLGDRAPAVCYLGRDNRDPRMFPPPEQARKLGWIVPGLFFPEAVYTALPQEDLALCMVLAAAAFLPRLRLIEVQDCDGVGARIVQASRAGLLPAGLKVCVTCHGTQVYLENASGEAKGDRDHLRRMALEKAAIENAHEVIFPTRFLMDLYRRSGYALPEDRARVLRYPFVLPRKPPNFSPRPIRSLVFFGRRNYMKGFDIFVDALSLLPPSALAGLREILVLGQRDPFSARENECLEKLRSRRKLRQLCPDRDKAVEELKRRGLSALVVVPYRADNHPNCVVEAMGAGCALLAADAGGIPELVPEAFHKEVLFRPDSQALAERIAEALARPPELTAQTAWEIHLASWKIQDEVNHGQESRFEAWPARPETAPGAPSAGTSGVLRAAVIAGRGQGAGEDLPLPAEKPGFEFFRAGEEGDELRSVLLSERPDFVVMAGAGASGDFAEAEARFLAENPGFDAASSYGREPSPGNGPGALLRPVGDGLILALARNFRDYAQGGTLRFSAWEALPGRPLDFPGAARHLLAEGRPIGVIPRDCGRRAAARGPGFPAERDSSPLPGLPLFDLLRLKALLAQFGGIEDSAAWTVAREVSRNPRLLNLGKMFFGALGRVYDMRRTR